MQKMDRNAPCPCGSGKKYKKCCLLKSFSPHRKEDSIRSSLLADILSFIKRGYTNTIDEAYWYFWDDFDPEEHLDAQALEAADINFWEWFVHDWWVNAEGGKTLIELYVEAARSLRKEEALVLNKMRDSVLSLYEVQEVFPEEGLLLKDLLLGGDYSVREKLATRGLRKWDILATRLFYLDGIHIMSGSLYCYPLMEKERIIKHLKQCFKDYKNKGIGDTFRAFLKQNSELFNYYWYENMREPFQPELMTTSGEPFLFANAVFEVKEKESVLKGLKKMNDIEEVEEEEDTFHWLDQQKAGEPTTILGSISVKGNTLKLECSSKNRLDRGKALILEHLGEAVTHKADSLQDPYQAMKTLPPTPRKPGSGIPKEVEQEIYTQYMQKHYESWLNEKLPALNDKTPLEMVKRPWGKKKVAELLKEIENAEEHRKRKGEVHFDTSWLWERLGLDKQL